MEKNDISHDSGPYQIHNPHPRQSPQHRLSCTANDRAEQQGGANDSRTELGYGTLDHISHVRSNVMFNTDIPISPDRRAQRIGKIRFIHKTAS